MLPPLSMQITPCDRSEAAMFVAGWSGCARHADAAPTARPAARATSAPEFAERTLPVAAGLPGFAFCKCASSLRAPTVPFG